MPKSKPTNSPKPPTTVKTAGNIVVLECEGCGAYQREDISDRRVKQKTEAFTKAHKNCIVRSK